MSLVSWIGSSESDFKGGKDEEVVGYVKDWGGNKSSLWRKNCIY